MSFESEKLEEMLEYTSSRRLFVETGSALGYMAEQAALKFEEVWTVEYHEDYYLSTLQRTYSLNNVKVVRGDSATWLLHILSMSGWKNAVLFLDAHSVIEDGSDSAPSGVTPVMDELDACLASKLGMTVIIDDRRLFSGNVDGYPSIERIEAFARSRGFNLVPKLREESDLIVLKSRS